ncbi:MAG TPA: branched-chain amino acid ABC transporter permease [Ruminococcus sp.]|nr:AzlC family ABC transporter permease [Ruminococcus sp.]HBB19650.1 branched-chain amino acid ABC transporter permease [Ruminococcus sp.]
MSSKFLRGMTHGLPIGLGYLSVSFGFGILAVRSGLSWFQAGMISLTNLTSAGQAAGVDIIAAAGTILEMVLVQLTINLRYSLMALSLSQKLDPKFTTGHRLLASYGITDEIFAVCSAQKELLSPAYMYGMILVATIGWVTGTLLGATAGAIVPGMVSAALGILLYGMFIAIIVPPAKKDKSVLAVVIAAALFSLLFKYVFTAVSGGFAIIICAVCASALGAVFFPVKDEEEQS